MKCIWRNYRNSLAVQWLGIHAFTAAGPSPITGQGTNSPQATRCSQKKKAGGEREEIKVESFPSLKKETDIQAQEGKSPKQDESKQTDIKTYN